MYYQGVLGGSLVWSEKGRILMCAQCNFRSITCKQSPFELELDSSRQVSMFHRLSLGSLRPKEG